MEIEFSKDINEFTNLGPRIQFLPRNFDLDPKKEFKSKFIGKN